MLRGLKNYWPYTYQNRYVPKNGKPSIYPEKNVERLKTITGNAIKKNS